MFHRSITHAVAGVFLACGILIAADDARAHEGPAILQAGGSDNRSSKTNAIDCSHEKGVFVCRGAASLAGGGATSPSSGDAVVQKQITRIVRIETKQTPRRKYRPLRTQGFYSGRGPRSRPFTQGFYADRTGGKPW